MIYYVFIPCKDPSVIRLPLLLSLLPSFLSFSSSFCVSFCLYFFSFLTPSLIISLHTFYFYLHPVLLSPLSPFPFLPPISIYHDTKLYSLCIPIIYHQFFFVVLFGKEKAPLKLYDRSGWPRRLTNLNPI